MTSNMKNNVTRYIELDSTYRNRNLYPYPSEFEIPVYHRSSQSPIKAQDPVVSAVPYYRQTASMRSDVANFEIIGSIEAYTTSSAVSADKRLIVTFLPGQAHQIENFYEGLTLHIWNTDQTTLLASNIILDSDILSNTQIMFTVSAATLPSYIDPLDPLVVTIKSPNTNNTPTASIFLPTTTDIDNDLTKGYLVRELSDGSEEVRQIINFIGPSRIAVVDGNFSALSPSDVFFVRSIETVRQGLVTTPSTSNTLQLSTSYASTGDWIRCVSLGGSSLVAQQQLFKIINIDSSNIITIEGTFSPTLLNGDLWQILPFYRENVVPLSYNHAIACIQGISCYELSLINISLPNSIIQGPSGGKIVAYPYVYVQLQTRSASGGHNSAISSNNPNSKGMLFRAVVTDTSNRTVTYFTKLTSSGMVQTIKFKPTDNLIFKVVLPNGELFRTVTEEFYQPQLPNPLAQITALFSMKQV